MGKTRTASCEIRDPGGTKGPFNETTGTYPTVPFPPHFTGTARVQQLNAQDMAKLVAEQQVTETGYLVVVDLSADQVKVGDVVTITTLDDNGDPALVDHELVVRSFGRGSLAWERDLICSDNLG